MLAVIADVNTSVAEREELIELIAIALLTKKNLFILGAPGQAKSYAINLFRQHITGARQFERLLSKKNSFSAVSICPACSPIRYPMQFWKRMIFTETSGLIFSFIWTPWEA